MQSSKTIHLYILCSALRHNSYLTLAYATSLRDSFSLGTFAHGSIMLPPRSLASSMPRFQMFFFITGSSLSRGSTVTKINRIVTISFWSPERKKNESVLTAVSVLMSHPVTASIAINSSSFHFFLPLGLGQSVLEETVPEIWVPGT